MSGVEIYLASLQSLVQVTQSLRTAAAENDMDGLMACLEERQALMDRIDSLPDEERPQSEGDRAVAAELLGTVAALDAETAQAVENNLSAIRQELEAQRQVSSTLSAYQKATVRATPAARFVDTQR